MIKRRGKIASFVKQDLPKLITTKERQLMKNTAGGITRTEGLISLILAFILPVIGMVFSIILIRQLKGNVRMRWMRVAAWIVLVLQILVLLGCVLGYLTFYFAVPELG